MVVEYQNHILGDDDDGGDESALSCLTINISQKTAKISTRIIYKNYLGFSSSREEFLMLFSAGRHRRVVLGAARRAELLKAPERREEIIKAEGEFFPRLPASQNAEREIKFPI
jgi:hypothetical protein